jgi:putative membrane protein
MIIKKVTITTALMAVGVITSLGYAAVAQTNRPESAPSQSTPPLPNRPAPLPNQPLPNRPAPLPNQPLPNRPLPGSNSQLSALDNQFVIEAAHGGMAEVRLGQLALQRSTSPQVKQFAQRMIQEHTQANTELMRLTTQKGINAPTDVGPKYQAAMMRLMQLSGAEFDQAYMNEAGVNAHLESAAVYQRQAALGLDPDLKAFASRTLPRVQGHLEMASRMTGYRFAQNGNTMPTSPTMNMPR